MHFEIELFRPPTENTKSSYFVFGGTFFDSSVELAKKYKTIEEARKDFSSITDHLLSEYGLYAPGEYVLRIAEIAPLDYSIHDYKEFNI